MLLRSRLLTFFKVCSDCAFSAAVAVFDSYVLRALTYSDDTVNLWRALAVVAVEASAFFLAASAAARAAAFSLATVWAFS